MSKQTIDVSQLSGWSNLSEGTQAVTVKTIVNGVENSASSNVVTVEKTLTKQTKEVSLLMVEGDQTILPDANMTMEKAIVKKPATLIPSNIKQGVSIGGVVGELTTTGKEEVEVSEELNMANGNLVISPPDNTKTLSQVTIIKPDTFIAQNIKNGVNIGGVVGTLQEKKDEEEKTVTITENGSFEVLPDANKVLSKVSGTVNVPSAKEEQEKTINITENGTVNIMPDSGKVLSKVTALVNVPTSSGAELNIHYGDTAPEDTSKLWVKTTEPESVEISPDFGYGEAIQTTGVKSGFPTSNITCEDGDYLYVVDNKIIKKYNKKTLEFIRKVATLSDTIYNVAIFEGILYCTERRYTSGSYQSTTTVNLCAVNLSTDVVTTLSYDIRHYGGNLIIYNGKIYLIGGGRLIHYNSSGNNDLYTMLDIDEYDILTKTTEKISYSYGKGFSGCCLVGNKVFVCGGYSESSSQKDITTDIISINLDTKTGTKCNAVLPIATYNMGVSNLGNYIYLSGGNKTSQIVYRYDMVNDTIEQVNVTLEHARTACATFFNGTELYLLGSNEIVDKLQIDVPLSSTKLKIISDWLNNQFAVVNSSSAKVMIGVNKAFKGDENNKAKEVTAYVHDGVNWHNLDGEITLTKLYAPKISISGKTLTITNDGRNGAYATNFKVYKGSTLLTTTTSTSVDLSNLITELGTYTITVRASGTNFNDSAASNAVSFANVASGYTVTITAAAGSYGVKIYDGTSSSGTLLGTIADQDNTPKTVTCSSSNLYLISDNGAYTDANTVVTGGVTIVNEGSWYYNGTFKVTADGTITISLACLIEGTQITLADGTTKAIEDITYDDELLVWNFYKGKFDIAKPTWIKVAEVAPRYNLVKFSNGAEVGFVGAGGEKGYHRIFNKEAGAFTHTGCKDTPNGTTTFAQDKTFPTVVSQEVVEKEVKFYNVITDKHYNLFANGILTSCKLSNEYNIKDMKYVGEKLISGKEKDEYFEKIKKSITFKSTRK